MKKRETSECPKLAKCPGWVTGDKLFSEPPRCGARVCYLDPDWWEKMGLGHIEPKRYSDKGEEIK
jgi:hypothetical protein